MLQPQILSLDFRHRSESYLWRDYVPARDTYALPPPIRTYLASITESERKKQNYTLPTTRITQTCVNTPHRCAALQNTRQPLRLSRNHLIHTCVR